MKKIFLFNGPPGSGKDTAANLMKELVSNVFMYKMALPLKDGCHKLLGLPGTLEDLEPIKEKNLKFQLEGMFEFLNRDLRKPLNLNVDTNDKQSSLYTTLRQFYIHVSENLMKPMFGEEIFGQLAIEYIKNSKNNYVAISDTGFLSEVMPLVEHFGKDHFVLVRLHREGSNFSNDSRSYIEVPGIRTYDIFNNGTLEDLESKLVDVLESNNVKFIDTDHHPYKPELDQDI